MLGNGDHNLADWVIVSALALLGLLQAGQEGGSNNNPPPPQYPPYKIPGTPFGIGGPLEPGIVATPEDVNVTHRNRLDLWRLAKRAFSVGVE